MAQPAWSAGFNQAGHKKALPTKRWFATGATVRDASFIALSFAVVTFLQVRRLFRATARRSWLLVSNSRQHFEPLGKQILRKC